MATPKDVAEYIIDVYTKYGIEIHSTGEDMLVINLPPKFRDVTEFCTTLNEEFGSIVDIEYDNTNLKAIVWIPDTAGSTDIQKQSKPTQSQTSLIFRVLLILFYLFVAIFVFDALRSTETRHAIRDKIASIMMFIANQLNS